MNQLKQQLREVTGRAIAAAKQATAALTLSIRTAAFEKLRVEACAGRKYAVVMSLKEGHDYVAGSVARNSQFLKPESLVGVAATIYKEFAGFKRTLQYWSRVEGSQRDECIVEGFNIVLEWTDADELIAAVEALGPGNNSAAIRQAIRQTEQAIAEKAKHILAQFEKTARLQAESGKNWAIVMSLKPGVDFTREVGSKLHAQAFDPAWLGPVAQAVYDACSEFETAFEFWSRVEGGQRDEYTVEGFNLIVRW